LIASPSAEFGSTNSACFRRQGFYTCDLVVVIDHLEGLDHVPGFIGKSIKQFHEVAAAMRQTIRHDRFEFAGKIPRQSVTHLDRRCELGTHDVPLSRDRQRMLATPLRPLQAVLFPQQIS
jgi:hypothetical protein